MRKCLLIFCMMIPLYGWAQKVDSVETKERKNLRFSILGGPGYTPDFGLLVGGSCLFTFSTNQSDTLLKRSVVPVAFAYMANGGGSFIIKPQLFFNGDKFRIFGQMSMNNTLDNYYGVGYETNKNRQRDTDSTEYRSKGYQFNPQFLFRYKDTDLFWGVSVDIAHENMTNPGEGVYNDENYVKQGGDDFGLDYYNVGLGINMSYDTRDIPANAYKGIFVEFGATFYSKTLGSTSSFGVVNLQYRQFKELKFLGERKVFAWMLNSRNSFGDVPISELSMIGSPFDLRGYYMGQYRDKSAIYAMGEYRHMFNAGEETKWQRLASKFGFAAWAGMGSIYSEFNNMSRVLPNFGAGLRIEVQPRMNFRVDIGHNPVNKQTLLYFNMTEAF
ncbi:hypothetical protein E9993_08350 [Labilibacter sediminis]|nr:hypothetical protein E9993_08350 [Labilibacter sediminis]